MQGSVWGSLCCVVLMDKLGKLMYNKPELLYYYKGVVAGVAILLQGCGGLSTTTDGR